MKIFSMILATAFFSTPFVAAAASPSYKVNMRVGIKGHSPISVNTVAKSGKKTFVSEISDDGQQETLIEVYAKKAERDATEGLLMDVTVTKRVRGHERISERAQIFAPENREMEFGVNSRGRTAGRLSLAVMAHRL